MNVVQIRRAQHDVSGIEEDQPFDLEGSDRTWQDSYSAETSFQPFRFNVQKGLKILLKRWATFWTHSAADHSFVSTSGNRKGRRVGPFQP